MNHGWIHCSVLCIQRGHTDTHLGRGKQGQRPDYHQITLSPHGSMTRRVVHFRLSTTYQRQNMSVWWSCTFHLIVFSHTHSSQQLFTLCKISYARKRLQCSGPQMIFTATNQRNWFCETGGHWNACLQATLMPNPPLLRLNEYIYIKSAQTEVILLPCKMQSFF